MLENHVPALSAVLADGHDKVDAGRVLRQAFVILQPLSGRAGFLYVLAHLSRSVRTADLDHITVSVILRSCATSLMCALVCMSGGAPVGLLSMIMCIQPI